MKQDVNFFLLGLLVFMVMAMIGLVMYSQFEYQNLHNEHLDALNKLDNKSAELNKTIDEVNRAKADLDAREASLVDIMNQLNLTKAKQASLGGFFDNLKGEKEILAENLSATQQDLQKSKTDYTGAKKDLQVCQQGLNSANQELTKKDAKIASMLTNIKYASVSLNQTDDSVFFMNKDLDDLKSQITDLYNAVGKMKTPDNISAASKSNIKGQLDDMQSYIDGKLANSLTSLINSINNAKKSISSIGSA